MDVEFSSSNKNCWDLFKESSNIWIKNSELDNHDFCNLEGLQLAGPSAGVLSPANWRPSRLKNSWLISSEFFHLNII